MSGVLGRSLIKFYSPIVVFAQTLSYSKKMTMSTHNKPKRKLRITKELIKLIERRIGKIKDKYRHK